MASSDSPKSCMVLGYMVILIGDIDHRCHRQIVSPSDLAT